MDKAGEVKAEIKKKYNIQESKIDDKKERDNLN